MAIFKLEGYVAGAEILGFARQVEFRDGVFMVRGITLEESHRILRELSTGKLVGVSPGEPQPQQTAPHTIEVVDAQAVPSNGKSQEIRIKQPEVKFPGKIPDRLDVPDEVPEFAVHPKKTDDEKLEETYVKQAAAPAPPVERKPVDPNVPPAQIVNATKLRDVVVYLLEQEGLTDVDKLVARCVALKPHSQLLQRASNLESRIKALAEGMNIGQPDFA